MKTPWWFKILVILLMVPLAGYPYILSNCPEESIAKALVWLFPAYTVCAAICAWISYPQRREVAWILVAMMALTDVAIYII